MDKYGIVIALAGMVLAALLPGWGSAKGCGMAGECGAGACTDDPGLFGKVLLLQLLPGTQGIYGFLIAVMTLMNLGIFGTPYDISFIKGIAFFAACLPVGIVCHVSAIHQAKASIASIHMLIKQPDQLSKALIFPVIVETYAVLSMLISLLAVVNVGKITI